MEPQEVQVVPSPILLLGLTALLAATAPWNTLTLGLYQNPSALNRNTAIADLTPATFVGYAPVAGLVFSSPYLDVDGSALVVGASTAFICTAPTTPNTIYGYYLANAALTSLASAYQFAAPIGVGALDSAVVVVPFLRFSGN